MNACALSRKTQFTFLYNIVILVLCSNALSQMENSNYLVMKRIENEKDGCKRGSEAASLQQQMNV